jgi:Spy/CpxP family protein refolding chaperone
MQCERWLRLAQPCCARAFAITVVMLLAEALCAPSFAETRQWWKSATVQQALELTNEQISTIDRIFRSDSSQRRRLAREQEGLELRLAAVLRDDALDTDTVSKLIERVVQAQARRNVSRTLMLVRMYRVLSPAQRIRFKRIMPEFEP